MELPEQEFSTECSGTYNLSRCVLNPNTFTMNAHTHNNRDSDAKLQHMVTFHSCGDERGLDKKVARMNAIMEAYHTNPSAHTIGNF